MGNLLPPEDRADIKGGSWGQSTLVPNHPRWLRLQRANRSSPPQPMFSLLPTVQESTEVREGKQRGTCKEEMGGKGVSSH